MSQFMGFTLLSLSKNTPSDTFTGTLQQAVALRTKDHLDRLPLLGSTKLSKPNAILTLWKALLCCPVPKSIARFHTEWL